MNLIKFLLLSQNLIVNKYKNSISTDEILVQVKGDKDGFTLKELISKNNDILLVKGAKPKFTLEIKKAGNTTINLTLEKSGYEDVSLDGNIEVKEFSFTDLVVNNKNSISKDELLAQVKGHDKTSFNLKEIISEDKNILLVKGTKPNFTIEVKKAGNTNLNLTLEKSGYEDAKLKGKVQVKVFTFTFDKLKAQANKITATEILANVKGLGKNGFTIKSITLKDNTFGNVEGTKPNLEIKLTKFGVFKADLVLEKSGNLDVKITDAEFIRKYPASTDLTFGILQKEKASGGNFTASEILDSVKGTKAGYKIKEIKDIDPSATAKVGSDGKSIDFMGSGAFKATLVLEHDTKEDVTLIKSKFAIIPKTEQFNIEEFTPTLIGGGAFPTAPLMYTLEFFNNTFYLFEFQSDKYYSSDDGKIWKDEGKVLDGKFLEKNSMPASAVFDNKLWLGQQLLKPDNTSDYTKIFSTSAPNSETKLNFTQISDDKIPTIYKTSTNFVVFKNKIWLRLHNQIGYIDNGNNWKQVWSTTKKEEISLRNNPLVYDDKIWTFGGTDALDNSPISPSLISKVFSFDGTNLVKESNLPKKVQFTTSEVFAGGILVIGGDKGLITKANDIYWSAYGKKWKVVKTEPKLGGIIGNGSVLKSKNEMWIFKSSGIGASPRKVYKITFTP